MNALIPIFQGEGKPAVSARDLDRFPGLRAADFARWAESHIASNPYAVEGEDWERLRIDAETPNGGRMERDDFTLTLPCAKKLAMMSKSGMAEQVRDYFIECERRALVAPTPSLPQTCAAALRALAAEVGEKERLALTGAELEPKAACFDAVTDCKAATSASRSGVDPDLAAMLGSGSDPDADT